MPDESPSIADIRLIALDGERSYETLPALRDVAIRVKVNVLEPGDADDPRNEPQLTTVLTTLFLEVFGADDEGDDEAPAQSASSPPEPDGADTRAPVYTGRASFRVDAEGPAQDDPSWVPAIFSEAWPYLRTQVISHALLLGMGRIPVPLEAPENLARQPHADQG